MMNFNETVEAGKVQMIGEPRQYRADCKAGAFKIGKAEPVGKTLKLEPIAAHMLKAQLFDYDPQPWTEILFVDEAGIVSSILFKGESLRNFLELYRKAVTTGQKMNAIQLLARMAERSNSKGSFFAVEFEIVGAGKFAEQIKALDMSNHFRITQLPGRKPGNGNGNHAEPETSAVATR
jgi:hypothetical protein